MSAPHVSAVIPVYNEEANLPELNARMTKALDSIGKPWELVYVDDFIASGLKTRSSMNCSKPAPVMCSTAR